MAIKNKYNLIEEIRSGSEKPLLELYARYRNEFIVWSQAKYKVRKELAQDVFQESLFEFYQNIISGRLTELVSNEKTYIFQIGKFKIINSIKKESRITYIENLQMIKGKEFEEFMQVEDQNYSNEQIKAAISKLPEDCQKVLKLYYFDEFDMESIAENMGYKNADTAKSKKSTCMKKLVIELKKLSMIFVF